MRQSFYDLVEAVRSIGISVVLGRDETRRARLGGDPADFPGRLLDLHDALENFDADSAADPTQDAQKMRDALVAVMRFATARGLDRGQLEEVVRVSVEEGRPKAPPSFGLHHRPHCPSRKWKPRLSMPTDRLSFLKRPSAKAQICRERDEIVARMGSALPGRGA